MLTMKRLRGWKNLAPYRGPLSALAALSGAEVVLRLALPWPMRLIVDQALGAVPPPGWLTAVAGAARESWLVFAVAIGALIQTAHQAVLMAHTRLHAATGLRLTLDLRSRLFLHLQSLSLRQHSRMPVGEAVYHLQSDAACLDHLIVRGVLPLASSIATLTAMFVVLLRIDVPLALVSLGVVPFLFVWIRWSARHLRDTAAEANLRDARLAARLHESFSAIRLVKSFAREPYEGLRFLDVASDAMTARVSLSRREAWSALGVGALIVLGTSTVILFGGFQVLHGRVTIGTLLLALAYVGFVYGPLSGIAATIGTIEQALVSERRVRKVFALTSEVDDGKTSAPALAGRVEFRHVSFSYDGRPVLRDISFTAAPGELVAIVGPSGSGKTTLVSLIPRFYDPQSGEILLDGQDSTRFRLRTLRQQVAVMLQEAIVLSGSVRDNLRYGLLEADPAAIEAAARAANAHDFIMRLEHGYDTELAEAGRSLSGGERQRLSIARAFLKNAPILILDEPTAALDRVSESLIVDAVERVRQGRTTFVIAHRLSTARHADRILVLDQGELVATGTHETLLASSELYRRLSRDFTAPGAAN